MPADIMVSLENNDKKLGLNQEELERIVEIMGREPNFTELSIFSVMWSEHCSYKNSIKYLKTLPRSGAKMLVEAGEENAGLIDIGDGLACAFKIESHNHPKRHRRCSPPAERKLMPESDYRIEFAQLDWTSTAPGSRVKELVRGDCRVRLVEMDEQFEEADWCRNGHVGWVIDGELEIEFDDRTLALKAGDGLIIPPGESSKHKARVPQGKATLFLVEQAAS